MGQDNQQELLFQPLSARYYWAIKLGNFTPTRDLTFVKDTVNAFMEISKNNKLNGKVTNIGMNKEISVIDLVNLIAHIIGENVTLTSDRQRIRPGKSEVERLMCNNIFIMENTAWKPYYTLKKGLSETIEFIRQNLDLYKPDIYNI